MRFNPNARLDSSQVSDRRRRGGAPLAIGGTSVVGLLLYLAIVVLGGSGDGSTTVPTGDPFATETGVGSPLASECRTGADANERQDCRIVAIVNSVQAYWTSQVEGYREAPTVLFRNRVTTSGCGSATSAVGPFYCPADSRVYVDLSFFEELQVAFGATGGPFAEAYVVAHEYGHHIQNLTGDNRRAGNDQGPTSGSVRLELQADCYAGVWASNAEGTGLIEQLTAEDIAVGLDAAASVGDDRIQESATGQINPETWTHGAAEQRQRWFTVGYETGDPARCDTFAAPSL